MKYLLFAFIWVYFYTSVVTVATLTWESYSGGVSIFACLYMICDISISQADMTDLQALTYETHVHVISIQEEITES